jgi:hypothetical protein
VACFEHLFFDLVDKSLREEANKRQKREWWVCILTFYKLISV